MTTAATRDRTPPLLRQRGRAMLTGNELIVKGALEGGVSLITGYPGSPVADVFTICEQIAPRLLELGVEAILANNEAQSAAMLNGARQVPGARALAVFKSVGAYVALDGLAITNSCLPGEGAAGVVVAGDDPALTSTQVGADSRATLSGARIPVLEPASFQEMKDHVRLAFELSAESGLVVGVMVTTPQADGGGVVDLGADRPPAVGPLRRVDVDTRSLSGAEKVSLPPHSERLERDLLERRIPLLHRAVAARALDRAEGPAGGRLGIVTAGASYVLVRDALAALGVDGDVPLLRLGLTWPIDPEPVRAFAAAVDEIVVVEERAGHLEDQVRRVLADSGRPVWGKRFPSGPGIPEASGLDPDIVRACLARLGAARPDWLGRGAAAEAEALLAERERRRRAVVGVLPRTPTYCAGCPHRGTSSPMLEVRRRFADGDYMRRVHGRGPVDVIAHGGIGCYSMAYLPPFNDMHDLSAMGLGGATGAGSAPHVTNKHYVLVGDGTFFHGEMSTIANAVKQRQDILFVILDNKTTAMTGHQGTPASDTDLLGRPQKGLSIHAIVQAMGPDLLERANPDDRDGYLALLERALLMDGTRVVIADKECAITKGRREREARARAPRPPRVVEHVEIAEDVCENCRVCTSQTGCPGLTLVDTPLGEKVAIDRDVCVDDAYCTRMKACPSFELVRIRPGNGPRAPRPAPTPPAADPPLPPRGAAFRIDVPGVGGMGVGVAARILIEAAADEWPAVDAYQRKGLAQRGGSVHASMVLHDGAHPRPAIAPAGELDLVIGLEPLETVRALRPADRERARAVVVTPERPTTGALAGDEPRATGAARRVRELTPPGGVQLVDVAEACREHLGSARGANVAALGVAYQRGWLPLSRDALERGIRRVSGPRHAAANLAAFALGRALAEAESPAPRAPSLPEIVESEAALITSARHRRVFRERMARAAAALPEETARAVAIRLADIVAWGGARYADRYLTAVARLVATDPALGPPGAHNLHRAMAIKDEAFVAHLLTSPKKYQRDRERLGLDPAAGDRIRYVHLNRMSLAVGGHRVELDLRTRDWMLRIVRHARLLRPLLPGWHRRERAFRDWYLDTVLEAVTGGRLRDAAALEALRLPETVTGFRQVRHPKEDQAHRRFDALLGAPAEKEETS